MEHDHRERMPAPSDRPLTQKDGEIVRSNVLRVKADPPGTTAEERKRNIKALGGAIAWSLRRFGEVHVRAIGEAAVYKAARGIIDASAKVAFHGLDLYCRPGYIVTNDMAGKDEMTGISFLVCASTNAPSQPQADSSTP